MIYLVFAGEFGQWLLAPKVCNVPPNNLSSNVIDIKQMKFLYMRSNNA